MKKILSRYKDRRREVRSDREGNTIECEVQGVYLILSSLLLSYFTLPLGTF